MLCGTAEDSAKMIIEVTPPEEISNPRNRNVDAPSEGQSANTFETKKTRVVPMEDTKLDLD